MENQLVVTLNVNDLRGIINESVSNALSKLPQPKEEETLLRRKDVAKLFSVSLVAISEWMKSARLPYHRINSRIFFKRSEVFEAMQSTSKLKRLRK